jgi:hypothetical protein
MFCPQPQDIEKALGLKKTKVGTGDKEEVRPPADVSGTPVLSCVHRLTLPWTVQGYLVGASKVSRVGRALLIVGFIALIAGLIMRSVSGRASSVPSGPASTQFAARAMLAAGACLAIVLRPPAIASPRPRHAIPLPAHPTPARPCPTQPGLPPNRT